jgi:hypothetical protein
VLQLLIALAALLGTGLQMIEAMLTAKQHDAVHAFRAVDDLLEEIPLHRPLKRRQQRREVRQLLRDSPREAADYRRMTRIVWSWTLLTCAAGAAVVQSIIDLR